MGLNQFTEFKGPVISQNGFQTASDAQITRVIKGTITMDPASVGSTTVADQTFTLTGAVVGDALILNPPATALTAGMLVCQAQVSATDTIKVRFYNTTGGAIDLGSASWTYCLIRS